MIGGANAIAVRVSLRELTPFWGAAFRFAIASVVLAAVVAVLRPRRPAPEHVPGIVLVGLLNFGVTYVFLYTGLRDAPAGTASVITALVPLMTIGLVVAHGIERFRRAGLVGSLVAALGIALVFGNQVSLDVPIPALVSLVAAALCLAETGVLVKRFPPGDPLVATAIALPIGAILLAALSVIVGEPWVIPSRPETWVAIGYLAVFASIVAFSLTLFILARWTASANSYSFLLIPLVTVVLGSLILGEHVEPVFLLGGALVLAGVYIGAISEARSTRRARSADAGPTKRAPGSTPGPAPNGGAAAD